MAFHFAQTSTSDEQEWLETGLNALSQLHTWFKHLKWNVVNKTLLLEAESHFSKGEREEAKRKYEAYIESARLHRFLHEEGLAMELFGQFLKENGGVDSADEYIANARSCYEKWGAFAVGNPLDAVHQ